jgi:hypothetical protein
MTLDQARKLLGGYASGTLTPEEQQALYAAALEHQELFDEMVREEALRELLSDPFARTRLLHTLDAPDAGWAERARRWLLGHSVGLAAAAGLVGVVGYVGWEMRPAPSQIRMVAEQPTRVEVNGGARREFDASALPRQSKAIVIPPPPALAPATAVSGPVQLPTVIAALSPKELPAPASANAVAMQRAEIPPPPSDLPATQSKAIAVSSFAAAESAAVQEPKAADAPAAAARPQAPRGGAVGGRAGAVSLSTLNSAQPATTLRRTSEQSDAALPVEGRIQIGGGAGGGPPPGFMPLAEGLRYRILRSTGLGRFQAAATNEFAVGSVVRFQFDADYPGSVRVIEAAAASPALVFDLQFRSTMTASSGEIKLEKPGTRRFRVEFTPAGMPAPEPAFITLQVKQGQSGADAH